MSENSNTFMVSGASTSFDIALEYAINLAVYNIKKSGIDFPVFSWTVKQINGFYEKNENEVTVRIEVTNKSEVMNDDK